jgi:hypothetical protein
VLLEHGADPTITDKHGKTAAKYAQERGDRKVLRVLTR